MNIVEAFANYMQDNSYGTLDSDLYIGGVPVQGPDSCWWVISSGGQPIVKNQTGEKIKNYAVQVFYRSINGQDVYDQLQALEELVNTGCPELQGYTTIEAEATAFAADQDLDNSERTVGLLQVTLSVYA